MTSSPCGGDAGRIDQQDKIVRRWRRVFNAVYGAADPPIDAHQPDLRGWVDPITTHPLPSGAMNHWLATTTTRIRSLSPRRILEIGAGTGNLAVALAPHVDTYTCTDISSTAISQLRHRVERAGLRNVDAHVLDATHIDELAGSKFDTVVLNSVCQYFPHQEYAHDVLRAAAQLLDASGALFIGDVRNNCLQHIEHAVIEAARGGVDEDLAHRVRRAVTDAPELTLAPSFFHQVARSIGEKWVAVPLLKRGKHRNVMTLFRYDIVLTPLHTPRGSCAARTSWAELGVAAVRQRLQEVDQPFWVTDIQNGRILAELNYRCLAESAIDGGAALMRSTVHHAVAPDWWHTLAKQYDRTAYVLWDVDRIDGAYSVFFDPKPASAGAFDRTQCLRRSIRASTHDMPLDNLTT